MTATAAPVRKRFRSRLVAGNHVGADPSGKVDPKTGKPADVLYLARNNPQIVESDEDLAARHPEKFVPVEGDGVGRGSGETAREYADRLALLAARAAADARAEEDINAQVGKPDGDDGLDAMSVKELQALAEAEEVDLSRSRSKAEIVAAIRQARMA